MLLFQYVLSHLASQMTALIGRKPSTQISKSAEERSNWCSEQASATSSFRCCSAARIAGIDSIPICDVTVRDLSGA